MREPSDQLDPLLSTEEVAEYLGIGQATIYHWCREGRLPAVKIGRRWRVRRTALEGFVRKNERSETLVGQLREFIEVPDNLLALVQKRDQMVKLDAAFFQVAEARGGTMVKYQLDESRLPSLEEVREKLGQRGLDVEGLKGEGRLRFVLVKQGEDMSNRVKEMRRLAEEESSKGRSVWVSMNWDLRMKLQEAQQQQRDLGKLIENSNLVIKTAVLEEDLDEWPGADQREAQIMHSGTIWLSNKGLSLSRVSPPPLDL
ncbi:MAG: helix-turn-helix domain-containing protein [Actinobacteria bacterium]|nr:helix-turn-helix domain-containing protein [Actinomycetota bacterium]